MKLVSSLGVFQLGGHEAQELVVVNLTIHVLIDVANDVVKLILGRVEAKLAHNISQLVMLNAVGVVSIEELPGLLDLIFLLR